MKEQQNNNYWNIFAQELQNVLHKYGMELGQLDDRVGIHREKVRRLIQSLRTPSSLPVLSPDDMEEIINTLNLDQEDVMRLRAAVLATSVQRMLSDRIYQDEARLAAEQILPTIVQSLTAYRGARGLGNVRGGDIDPLEDDELSIVLETALDAIDRGSNALSLSTSVNSYTEQVRQARQALDYYGEAMKGLQRASRAIRRLPGWQQWHDEAQKGFGAARGQLDKLGEP